MSQQKILSAFDEGYAAQIPVNFGKKRRTVTPKPSSHIVLNGSTPFKGTTNQKVKQGYKGK